MPVQSLTGSFTLASTMWVVGHYTNPVNLTSNSISPLNYVQHAFEQPFANIKLKCTAIQSLKTNTLMDMTIYQQKISTPNILSRLTYICNKVLATGVFPDRLNYSEII
jgi:hypothetical protein